MTPLLCLSLKENFFAIFFTAFSFYNGTIPMLLVMDLDLIKKILIKDFGNFHERGVSVIWRSG